MALCRCAAFPLVRELRARVINFLRISPLARGLLASIGADSLVRGIKILAGFRCRGEVD